MCTSGCRVSVLIEGYPLGIHLYILTEVSYQCKTNNSKT